jgi:hypothetical protein
MSEATSSLIVDVGHVGYVANVNGATADAIAYPGKGSGGRITVNDLGTLPPHLNIPWNRNH